MPGKGEGKMGVAALKVRHKGKEAGREREGQIKEG